MIDSADFTITLCMCVGREIEYEYTKYSYRQCSRRNELYMGASLGLADCQSKCNNLEACISFEFWSSTEGSGAHSKGGENHCQLSSSCTYARSVSNSTDPSDLYVKKRKIGAYVCVNAKKQKCFHAYAYANVHTGVWIFARV